MKILVTGSTGQLGYDVIHEGIKRGYSMIGTSSSDMDITNKDVTFEVIEKLKPNAIIHCAAYTAVDKAEDDKETCWNVNVEGTKNLAEVARKLSIKFMYISTDYVFDGLGSQPFSESDQPNPSNYYGKTKYEGEKIIQTLLENWFIIRISWVFGLNGNNFVKTMLRLAESHNELSIVSDQVGSPTYTFDLAPLLLDMIQTDKFGIYHVSNDGFCSWADFAREIFRLSDCDVSVHDIKTEEYKTRATRPKNSRMCKQGLFDNGFKSLQHWKKALEQYLQELHEVK